MGESIKRMTIPKCACLTTLLAVACSLAWLSGCGEKSESPEASTDNGSARELASVPLSPTPTSSNVDQAQTPPVLLPIRSEPDETVTSPTLEFSEITLRYLAEIEGITAFARLESLQEEYKGQPERSTVVEKAFTGKWRALTATMSPKTLVDGLDLLAVETDRTGPREYTFSFLLHTADALDTDYHLFITGKVEPNHVQYIEPAKPGANYARWALPLYGDPTSKWGADEYHVVRLKVKTENIPYDISVLLHTRDARSRWAANVGNVVELGWQSAD